MKILFADDNPETRTLLETALSKWDFEYVAAHDGNEALDILLSDDPPRIALMDWVMPGCDGIDICRKVRQQVSNTYIYLMLLTSKNKSDDIVNGLEAGADDYLTKPFNIEELHARILVGKRILKLHDRLIEMAMYDAMTGLLNHAHILKELEDECERSLRNNVSLSVILADLDHFKSINDTFGHQAGDKVLKQTAQKILKTVRQYDSVGRYGGEEFLLVLPNCNNEDAYNLAERVRQNIESMNIAHGNQRITLTISLGVTSLLPSQYADKNMINRMVKKAKSR